MSEISFSGSDNKFHRYLFEYQHDGADWGIEICARSPQEAKERINSLAWARYKGEIKANIPLSPTKLSSLFQRIKWW
jgi:hypothetical protein